MSYGDHIDYNTGQKCDCSLAISGGHYRGRAETVSLSHSCPTCDGKGVLGGCGRNNCDHEHTLMFCNDCNPQPPMTAELALFEIDPSKIIDGTYGYSDSGAPSYVMEGVCRNCNEVVYGRFEMGQKTRPLKCNYCGYWGVFGMSWKRLVK